MRKFSALAIAAAVIFIIMSVSANACGDKNKSAKSAKVDASKANAEVVQASANAGEATAQTAEASYDKASHCSSAKAAKAMQASVRVKTADSKYCPATAACPAFACPTNSKGETMESKAGIVETEQPSSETQMAMAPKTAGEEK
jgi:hypothetical protein